MAGVESRIVGRQRTARHQRIEISADLGLGPSSAAVKVVRRFSVVSAIALIPAKPHHGGRTVRLTQPTTE